jgi:hypothetical protein
MLTTLASSIGADLSEAADKGRVLLLQRAVQDLSKAR